MRVGRHVLERVFQKRGGWFDQGLLGRHGGSQKIPPYRHLILIGDVMSTVIFSRNNRFLPVFESGNQSEIDALLSQTATMSETDLNVLNVAIATQGGAHHG